MYSWIYPERRLEVDQRLLKSVRERHFLRPNAFHASGESRRRKLRNSYEYYPIKMDIQL